MKKSESLLRKRLGTIGLGRVGVSAETISFDQKMSRIVEGFMELEWGATGGEVAVAMRTSRAAGYLSAVLHLSRNLVDEALLLSIRDQGLEVLESIKKLVKSTHDIPRFHPQYLLTEKGRRTFPYELVKTWKNVASEIYQELGGLQEAADNLLRTVPIAATYYTQDMEDQVAADLVSIKAGIDRATVWIDAYEDIVDLEVARRSIEEIEKDPDCLVTGAAAEATLKALIDG